MCMCIICLWNLPDLTPTSCCPSTVSANNLYQYLLCCRRGGHKSHACYACHFSIVAVTLQKKCAWGRREPTCCGRKKPLATWGIERNSVVLTLMSVQPQSQQEPRISCSPGFISTYSARFCVDERATVLLISHSSPHHPRMTRP